MNIIKVFVTLLILVGCYEVSEQNESKHTSCFEHYYYLEYDEYGIPNSEEKVLLHLSNTDSIYVDPGKVCSLHVAPIWKKKEFPFEVLNFSNLTYLWVAMRDFKSLPNEITQLKQLKHLDIQNSGLENLPDNIGELKELEELVLLFSNVEKLPNSICELSNLKKLHLGGTKVKRLPPCLNQLQILEKFILFYEDKEEFSEELKIELETLKKQLKKCKFMLN